MKEFKGNIEPTPIEEAARPMIVPVFIPNAGCTFRCVFCNQEPVTGQRPGPVPTDQIPHDIERFLNFSTRNRHPIQISFYGGNFLGLPFREQKAALDAAQRFIDRGAAHSIRFSTRPDTIDDRRLDRLKGYSVSTIEIGAQSMCDEVLRICRRGHDARHTLDAVTLLKERGFQIGLQMMIGLPGDTACGALETARRLAELGPDFVRIYPTVVIKNSPLAELFHRGTYFPLGLPEAVSLTKHACLLFGKKKIPVVRMGLHPSEELASGDAIVAGPFHPAFGHLVLSEIVLDKVLSRLSSIRGEHDVLQLAIHPRSESRLRGQKNANIQILKQRGPYREVKIVTDASLPMDEPIIFSGKEKRAVP